QALAERPDQISQGSVVQAFAVCGSCYQRAIDAGLPEVHPSGPVKQKSGATHRITLDVAGRSLTPLQWSYVSEPAEKMADEDETYERTLFILTALFAMYLRVSDLVGRDNWEPTMGDFRKDTQGNWWFNVVGKGNKAAKIS